MATGFFKAVNLILFLRSNFPLFVLYGVFCIGEFQNLFTKLCYIFPAFCKFFEKGFKLIMVMYAINQEHNDYFCTNFQNNSVILVLFVAVPESIYSGPDSVQLFSAASLEVLKFFITLNLNLLYSIFIPVQINIKWNFFFIFEKRLCIAAPFGFFAIHQIFLFEM